MHRNCLRRFGLLIFLLLCMSYRIIMKLQLLVFAVNNCCWNLLQIKISFRLKSEHLKILKNFLLLFRSPFLINEFNLIFVVLLFKFLLFIFWDVGFCDRGLWLHEFRWTLRHLVTRCILFGAARNFSRGLSIFLLKKRVFG